MIRFYAPYIETDRKLPESDSTHCSRVLRMKAGDIVHIVDGKGNAYTCIIVNPHPKATTVEIIEKIAEPATWPVNITLGVAPTKNIDRIEWLLEKAVEIGINRVVILDCDRNERKKTNCERLERIMISAMKQSLKALLPTLETNVSLSDFVKATTTDQKYIGYCDAAYPRKEFAKEYITGQDVTILIGPEGDFSPTEIETAVSAGFTPVTFGNSRLRTETAALFAITAIHAINQEHN